jgi:putative sigma-54 modulation protein
LSKKYAPKWGGPNYRTRLWCDAPVALACTAYVAPRHEKAFAFAEKGAHSGVEGAHALGVFGGSGPAACGLPGFFILRATGVPFMNLTISGHHLEVTPALRTYVTGKLDRITRHFDQVVDVKVLLSIENQKEKEQRQRAECNIHVKGSDLFAESAHSDLYAAVDDLVDKLDRQVVRHKDRIQDHHHAAPKRLM